MMKMKKIIQKNKKVKKIMIYFYRMKNKNNNYHNSKFKRKTLILTHRSKMNKMKYFNNLLL